MPLVRSFMEAGKPVAPICHGAWVLVEIDAVRGRRMTSTGAISTDLKNAGADWVDEEFVRDGNLLTSRNPDDLPAFNEGIVSGPAVGALRYPHGRVRPQAFRRPMAASSMGSVRRPVKVFCWLTW